MKESSYSKGIFDFRSTPSYSCPTSKNEDIIDRPCFKENFLSRFFCLFCVDKSQKGTTKNTTSFYSQDTEKKKYSQIYFDETKSHIKIVHHSTKNTISEKMIKEKNQMENSKFSDLVAHMNRDIQVQKPHKPLTHSFPHNQCFFLNFQDKYIVLARIQNKKFYLDENLFMSHNPDIFCDYLAMKLKTFSTVLQYGAKSSNQISQLSKKCEMLYIIDPSLKGLNNFKKSKWPLNNVEFIQSNVIDCLNAPTYAIDAIFINPIWKTNQNDAEIISFEQLEPHFINLLSQALNVTQNIVVSLPIYVNLNEMAKIIRELEDKNLIKNKRNSIEFEFIYFNKKLMKIMMFLGNANNISFKEGIEFYSKFLQEDFHSDGQNQEFQDILAFLKGKLGFDKLCDMVPLITKPSMKNESSSLLQKLIDNLIDKGYITREELHEFLNDKKFQTNYTIISSFYKESLEETSFKLIKKNSMKSGKHKNSVKKLKKKLSMDAVQFSSYSNYSGILFEGNSSMCLDEIKHNDSNELYKIEEVSYHNSSSLKNTNLEKGFFKDNFHETYG